MRRPGRGFAVCPVQKWSCTLEPGKQQDSVTHRGTQSPHPCTAKPGWCDHLNLKNPKVDLAAVQSTLRKHGLDCHAISAYGNPVELVMERLETLKALGGYALVRGSAGPDVSVKSFADSLLPLVKRAEALGVTLAIENHGQAAIDSIDSMVELCRLVPSPGLGIALAPIHLYRRNERTEDAVQALRGRIAFFYAWDWGPSADKNW
ncbi:MAG: sugar phosphate isomerase/epimerase, partial [Armatimonadetes bacterium]|nr:sugar phosphate isomerase/epimerase [Armatimonadota bacterium]